MYVVGCDKIKMGNIGWIRWIELDKIVVEFWKFKSYVAVYELPSFCECQKVGLSTVKLISCNYLFCVWWWFGFFLFVCLLEWQKNKIGTIYSRERLFGLMHCWVFFSSALLCPCFTVALLLLPNCPCKLYYTEQKYIDFLYQILFIRWFFCLCKLLNKVCAT